MPVRSRLGGCACPRASRSLSPASPPRHPLGPGRAMTCCGWWLPARVAEHVASPLLTAFTACHEAGRWSPSGGDGREMPALLLERLPTSASAPRLGPRGLPIDAPPGGCGGPATRRPGDPTAVTGGEPAWHQDWLVTPAAADRDTEVAPLLPPGYAGWTPRSPDAAASAAADGEVSLGSPTWVAHDAGAGPREPRRWSGARLT